GKFGGLSPCCCLIISIKDRANRGAGTHRSWVGNVAEETPAIDMPVQWTLRSAGRHVRNPFAVYVGLALTGMALIILTVAPLASKVVQRWSQRDVELRSRLVFNSIRDQVASGLAGGSSVNLVTLFNRIAEDERLLGLAFCSEDGQLLYATKRLPS